MQAVAQLVEHRIVAPDVVGSIPIGLPGLVKSASLCTLLVHRLISFYIYNNR